MPDYLICVPLSTPIGKLRNTEDAVHRLCSACGRTMVLQPAGIEYAHRTGRPLICDFCAKKKGLFR